MPPAWVGVMLRAAKRATLVHMMTSFQEVGSIAGILPGRAGKRQISSRLVTPGDGRQFTLVLDDTTLGAAESLVSQPLGLFTEWESRADCKTCPGWGVPL